jgi:Rrf2 family transcriptional regulator, iron-sulfur cluster assembly transcription factor
MFFTKTSTYALRVLILMAEDETRSYSANDIYKTLNIKLRYLRKLMTDLTRYGFVTSSRGRNGGYVFARKAETIYLADIIDAVEGFDSFSSCILGVTDCKLNPSCSMHELWQGIKAEMIRTLSTTTLLDLRQKKTLPF